MDKYLELLGGLDVWELIITAIIVVIVFLAVILIYHLRKQKRLKQQASNQSKIKESKEKNKKEPILGTGTLPCYVLRNGALEASTIPEEIGNLFIADISMPRSGSSYLVREIEEGKLEAYDPREIPFETEKSPQWAYFATHWGIVKDVYAMTNSWWQSVPLWLCITMIVVLILVLLVVLG